jgi:hypothetical protein
MIGGFEFIVFLSKKATENEELPRDFARTCAQIEISEISLCKKFTKSAPKISGRISPSGLHFGSSACSSFVFGHLAPPHHLAIMTIQKVFAREILDSRGNPTVEVDVHTEKVRIQQIIQCL